MPQVDMRDMLNHAYRNGYAVGVFDLTSLDYLGPIIAAAECCRSPVILNLDAERLAAGDLAPAMAAAETAAARAAVPVAIQLDRGAAHESAVRAINLGCTGVSLDISPLSFVDNVAQTRRLVEMAHACGVAVEGEPGRVASASENPPVHAGETRYTSVAEAAAFVTRTGVDCLVVNIGTAPCTARGRPRLDFERLKRINDAVRIPLVIQAGNGLTEEQYRRLIVSGVAKIHCRTALAEAAGRRARAIAPAEGRVGTGDGLKDVRENIREEVKRCLRVWGSAGRAAEVIVQCAPWQPVEHVILYNIEHATDAQVEAMMARGRDVLGAIPGVRRVVTGWAVTEKPRYRFCWLVEFVHERVIAAYRDHPEHVAFANGLFRPIAGELLSIDFQSIEAATPAHALSYGQRVRA
jgi:fructose-bisphosphate aldolase class II